MGTVVSDFTLRDWLFPAIAEHLLTLDIVRLAKVVLLGPSYCSAPSFVGLSERDLAIILRPVEVVELVAWVSLDSGFEITGIAVNLAWQ